MKKYLILSLLLTSIPVFAACSIEEGGACSIAGLMSKPIQRTYSSSQPLVKEFNGNAAARLQPAKNDMAEKQLRNFGAQPSDYSYNSSCQFGICNETGAPKLFERRGN